MTYATIAGSGSFLPERVVSNDALAAELATRNVVTSDEWIVERTGIRQRHLAERGVTTSQLATEAAKRALADAGVQAEDVDLIIVATSTPDFVFPSTACLVQANLGAKGGAAFDVQAVCSGFVYALSTADAFVRAGRARCALVIGAEVFSSILDWSDRGTCVLFGDGAGAVVLKASEEPGILAAHLHARKIKFCVRQATWPTVMSSAIHS
jgi:3-oxoacyl-[acyl-carrier-protein] synthase-3